MKNLFRKTSKGTTPKALKIKCTKETKEQVSNIMKKYGWTFDEFERLIKKEGLKLNIAKVIEDTIDNINFSNEDETEKTIFFQVNETVLEVLIIQSNQIITLDIEKKKEKKDKMEEAVLKREIQVLNGRIITPDIEQNKIQIEVRIGKRIKYNIKIADDRYSTSRVIECIKIKIKELFDVIAHSKEKEMGSNLIEEIDELLKNSNVSESEKEFMTVKVQKEQTEVDRKIIFKTIRRQHLRTDTVKVQNSKEELEYYIHDKLWIYTTKKVILKGGEDTSTYDATFAEDEIENLEKNIRRAKKIVEEIKTWK
nr:MAG TPA: hypothetical protein [Caudoviricetes sp.]